MRVLIAHCVYSDSSPSGENRTVGLISDAVEQAGVQVNRLLPRSDDLSTASVTQKSTIAWRLVISGKGDLSAAVSRIAPDVVQVHNYLPHFGPGELSRIRRQVPVVHVFHNYRHTCLSGNHFLNGEQCHRCIESPVGRLEGVRRACYRGSKVQSAALAYSESRNENRWRSLDAYVAISGYVREHMVGAGFPRRRIDVIPNPATKKVNLEDNNPTDALFAGRLSEDKGVGLLIKAWQAIPPEEKGAAQLHIAGSGPAENALRALCFDQSIIFHGRLTHEELQLLAVRCKVTVVPSIWHEPFGRVVVEAYAEGRGVVVSARGGLPELASDDRCGWVFEPNATDLAATLTHVLHRDPKVMANAANDLWESRYSPLAVGDQYIKLWRSMIESRNA